MRTVYLSYYELVAWKLHSATGLGLLRFKPHHEWWSKGDTVTRGQEGERESSVSLFALMVNARWATVVRNLDPRA